MEPSGKREGLSEDFVGRPPRKVQTQVPGWIGPAGRPRGKGRGKDGDHVRAQEGEILQESPYRAVVEHSLRSPPSRNVSK